MNEINYQLDDFFKMHLLTYRRVDKQMTVSEHLKLSTVVCKDQGFD